MTSRHTVPNAKTTNNQEILQIVNDDDTNSIIKHYNTLEHESWKNLIHINNTKQIWEKIDFNGKCKENKATSDTSCNEFAEYLENRCSLPYQHTDYNDLKTDVFNPTLDSKITEKEIIDATSSMNNGSKAKCGIPLPLFSMVLYSMLGILTYLLNKVFTSKYPRSWSPFIYCLPKKGKLNIPFVRGISIKPLLGKLYDAVLKNRLQRWLQIPEQQTAYQKGKGCILHVFFMRCLIAICMKLKKPIYIGITDFEAAFDYISRRKLFIKLINLGIGMFMLTAIIEMYKVIDAHVYYNGVYSKTIYITAGVMQGSASSTLLFMAYTSDLINIFNNYFPTEEIIHYYHILLHADDSLILATNKKSLVNKFKKLDEYCLENNIKLQLSKCAFLGINVEDKMSFTLENGTINCVSEFVYLGSIITNRGSIPDDIKMEIKRTTKSLHKFFAFIGQNYNAPLYIKEKVLESCVTSALLYNCESW